MTFVTSSTWLRITCSIPWQSHGRLRSHAFPKFLALAPGDLLSYYLRQVHSYFFTIHHYFKVRKLYNIEIKNNTAYHCYPPLNNKEMIACRNTPIRRPDNKSLQVDQVGIKRRKEKNVMASRTPCGQAHYGVPALSTQRILNTNTAIKNTPKK